MSAHAGYWEQADAALARRVAQMFTKYWSLIDGLIAKEIGAHLTRGHALRVARMAIELLESEEVKRT